MLYTIQPEQLQQFQALAYTLQFPPVAVHEKLNDINPFITAANVFFALKAHKGPMQCNFYLDETKRLAYAAAFFQLEYIERSRTVKAFVERADVTDKTLVMLSYYISYYVMDWVIRVMEEVDAAQIVEHYLEEENFKANMKRQQEDEHQRMQRAYMQAMAMNVQKTAHLPNAIAYAIRDTYMLLRKPEV